MTPLQGKGKMLRKLLDEHKIGGSRSRTISLTSYILFVALFGLSSVMPALSADKRSAAFEPNSIKRYMFSCATVLDVRSGMEKRSIALKSDPVTPKPGERTVFSGASQSGIENPYVIENACGKLHVYIDLRRPQHPVGPLPYLTQEVVFDNAAAPISIVGTISYPKQGGPFPGVVLVAGSGAHTRDELVSLHKIFLVLADHLTRKGIAVLRYDKRGVGMSGGLADPNSTTDDYASDAGAAVRFMRFQPEIDPAKVGIIGHSEGGIIAPMVAAGDPEVAFIVLLAGTGLPGMDVQMHQENARNRARGVDERITVANDRQNKVVFPMIIATKDNAEALKKIHASEREVLTAEERKLMGVPDEGVPDEAYSSYLTPWFRRFLELDPRPYLEKVKCPALALNGDKDLAVLPDENLSEIDKALRRGGNLHASVKKLSGINHMLQSAPAGQSEEGRNIEETIAPVVLNMVSSWILSLGK
jgi:uncharacterized protein